MIDTRIGERDVHGTCCIGFQKGIVHTLRGLISTRLPAGIGFNLSEEPFFRVQFFLDHYPLAHQS